MTDIQKLIQKCVDQIIQQNPIIKNIFNKIHEQNGKILLVGGIVRDCLLQKPGSDLDFEVYHLSFDQLQSILKEFGPVSFVGKSFGVLRLHTIDADWSIPRKDSSGRKPKVDLDPNMNFIDAFRRRDLTINAMGIDVKTLELIDPYDGQCDLEKKILRSPDPSFFVQDPLRLFRVMQFTSRLHMQPNDELSNICQQIDISTISTERINDEFKKLFLKSDQPSIGLSWLQQIGQFEKLFPTLSFNQKTMKSIDCLSNQNINTINLKLSSMWALLACDLKNTNFDNINIEKQASKNDLLPINQFLKKHVISSEIIDSAVKISWYVHYIPLIIKQDNISYYKLLSYWLEKICTLKNLALIGSCLYEKTEIDLFIKNSQSAGVLYQYEKPLLLGKDLLHITDGKKLGDLIKKAYELQITLCIKEKDELLKKLLN